MDEVVVVDDDDDNDGGVDVSSVHMCFRLWATRSCLSASAASSLAFFSAAIFRRSALGMNRGRHASSSALRFLAISNKSGGAFRDMVLIKKDFF